MTIAVWPFLPDWTNPVLETYEWKTSILTSRNGAEQRMAQRSTPRRVIDYPVQLYSHERSLFDVWIMQNSGHVWWVPIPSEGLPGAYSLGVGDTFIPFDTAFRESSFQPGQAAIMQSDAFTCELVEIISISPSGIRVSPLTKNYTAGWVVSPAMLCQITDTVTAARNSGAFYTATVRFQSMQNNPRLAPTPYSGYLYQGYPVLTTAPNSISDIEYTYERPMFSVDNGTGIPVYSDPRGYATQTQRFEFFLVGREERREFIDFLYRLMGQLQPIWVPTFNDDLAPGRGWVDPDGLLGSVPLRNAAIEFKRDGSYNIREAKSGGTQRSQMLYTDSDIRQTSFITLKRLGVDSVEISNYAGAEGVATASVLFRDAPDIRVAGTYYKNPFVIADSDTARAAATNPPLDLAEVVTVGGMLNPPPSPPPTGGGGDTPPDNS